MKNEYGKECPLPIEKWIKYRYLVVTPMGHVEGHINKPIARPRATWISHGQGVRLEYRCPVDFDFQNEWESLIWKNPQHQDFADEHGRNDCYKCPHRGQVSGSAHSTCNILGNADKMFPLALRIAAGNIQSLQQGNKTILEFNMHGVRNGWCMWPINFDPVWVTCKLDIHADDTPPV